MDLVVLGLQGLSAGLLWEKQRGLVGMGGAGGVVKVGIERNMDGAAASVPGHSSPRRSARMGHGESDEGVEMQPLMQGSAADADEAVVGSSTLEALNPQRSLEADLHPDTDMATEPDDLVATEAHARHSLETLYSGQALLLDLSPWHVLRQQYYERRNRALAGRV